MNWLILALAFTGLALLVWRVGNNTITRTWAQHDAAEAARTEIRQRASTLAEVPHQDADEEWAEEVHHIAEEMAADPARTLPPPALDLTKHQPEVPLDKPVPWHKLPARADEATPLLPNRPLPHFDPDLDRRGSVTEMFGPDLIAWLRDLGAALDMDDEDVRQERLQAMMDARYGRTS